MTTAQEVFKIAIHLMDEQDEQTGAADRADTVRFKTRALSILNILQEECYPCSDTYTVQEAGGRPPCPPVTDFEDAMGLDDGLCRGVLPYGLAAHLLLDENMTMASYFNERYEERKNAMKNALPRAFEEIGKVYGGIEFSRGGHW